MPEKAAFLAFLIAAFALNLAPGPDMLYVIGRSVGQGRRAGIVSSLGVFVGCWVHILAAAFGIAALLRSSPLAFNVVRYAGAAYLIYLGIRMLAQKTDLSSQQLKQKGSVSFSGRAQLPTCSTRKSRYSFWHFSRNLLMRIGAA
jgi:threonine/homoserine/homoserine lactone efflux protein